jgi:hypothetical protein
MSAGDESEHWPLWPAKQVHVSQGPLVGQVTGVSTKTLLTHCIVKQSFWGCDLSALEQLWLVHV